MRYVFFDIYSKCAPVIPLKDKKGITITNAFQITLDKPGRKPNKMWLDKGSEFYYRSLKSWLEKNCIEMYSTHNEVKSVVAERFIRTLKNKLHKHMTLVSKNVYISNLDAMVNKYNNTYHSSIKMKPADVKSSTYIDFDKNNNNKEDPKIKVGDYVRISKYKNIFANGYVPNWYEEVVVITKVKNTVPWINVISDLKGEEIVETFYKK